jgi:hypothetical protein
VAFSGRYRQGGIVARGNEIFQTLLGLFLRIIARQYYTVLRKKQC